MNNLKTRNFKDLNGTKQVLLKTFNTVMKNGKASYIFRKGSKQIKFFMRKQGEFVEVKKQFRDGRQDVFQVEIEEIKENLKA